MKEAGNLRVFAQVRSQADRFEDRQEPVEWGESGLRTVVNRKPTFKCTRREAASIQPPSASVVAKARGQQTDGV